MVSMKDIADRLHLSRTTVSNILNSKLESNSYKEETIELVKNTAKEMGYIPNTIAKSLKTGFTQTIALVVPDIANTFYVKIIKEVELLANKHGYSLIICMAEEKLEKEFKALNMLKSRMVDGILIAPVSYNKSLLEDYPFKIICFDRTVENKKIPSVTIDNKLTSFQLTNEILESNLSSKAPLFLAGSEQDYTVKYRLQGYKDSLKDKGILFKENNIIYNIYDEESAYDRLNSYIERFGINFESIILSTNYFIYGVLKTLYENNNYFMPIGGFERFIGYDIINANILYVNQPEKQIAKIAFKKLIDLLNGEKVKSSVLNTSLHYSETYISLK